jgi:hypothetical protein
MEAEGRHDEQPSLHHDKALQADRVVGGRVVHIQAGKVEQAREPSDYAKNVNGFEPEHACIQ